MNYDLAYQIYHTAYTAERKLRLEREAQARAEFKRLNERIAALTLLVRKYEAMLQAEDEPEQPPEQPGIPEEITLEQWRKLQQDGWKIRG